MLGNVDTASFDEEFGLDMQKKFISVLVFDQNWAAINGLEVIKPEYFENKILCNICSWIHQHYKKFQKIPTKLMLKEAAKDYSNKYHINTREFYLYEEALDDIFNITENDDLEFFKEKAVIFVRQMAWKQALMKGTDVLKLGTYEEAMTEFKKVLSIGSENDLGLDLSEISTDTFIQLLGETYDKSNMLKTGLETWDRSLGGGFVKNNVHIIAAPPGYGKSRTMAFLAKQALTQFKKVIFITLELTEAETLGAIYTSAIGLSYEDMLNPINRQEFEEKKEMFKNTFSDQLLVKFYKPNTITTNTIHNYIQKVIDYKKDTTGQDWYPDVIFIDYMDKLLPTQKIKGSIYEDNGNVATDCKNLGISFKCPVISGSQLGRTSWNTAADAVVSMESIAESAQKVHIAHSMTTINVNSDEKNLMRARLYVAKSRSGRPNTIVWCEQNLGRCSLQEIEPWDPKTLQNTASVVIHSINK